MPIRASRRSGHSPHREDELAGAVVAFAATASAVPPVGAPADRRAAAPPEAGDVRLRGAGAGAVAGQEQGPL